jgi:hypothetical protein
MAEHPPILLTGDMRDHEDQKQIKAVFYGRDVWLPVEEFRALVALVAAGSKNKSAKVSREIMESMKRRIDEATGRPGLGDSLFAKGPKK